MTRIGSRYITAQATELEVQNNGSAVVTTDKINFIGATVTDDPAGTAKVTITGVTLWTESESAATQQNTRWTPNNAAANISAVIQPKGTGANLAHRPDGTATGGNARGQYATDWQKIRVTNVKVASGNYSVITGGSDNQASGIGSAVGGGESNIASGDYSSIAGGFQNQSTAAGSNTTGTSNIASSSRAHAAGESCLASGLNSFAEGLSNQSTGDYSRSEGYYSKAYIYGQTAHASGRFGAVGDAQMSTLIARKLGTLTSSGSTVLNTDGGTGEILPDGSNRIWAVDANWTAVVTAVTGTPLANVGDFVNQKLFFGYKIIGGVGSITPITTISTQGDASLSGLTAMAFTVGVNQNLVPTFTAQPMGAPGSCTFRILLTLTLTEIAY